MTQSTAQLSFLQSPLEAARLRQQQQEVLEHQQQQAAEAAAERKRQTEADNEQRREQQRQAEKKLQAQRAGTQLFKVWVAVAFAPWANGGKKQ